jgi:hypothetical protein
MGRAEATFVSEFVELLATRYGEQWCCTSSRQAGTCLEMAEDVSLHRLAMLEANARRFGNIPSPGTVTQMRRCQEDVKCKD